VVATLARMPTARTVPTRVRDGGLAAAVAGEAERMPAERIHGVDERVHPHSMVATAQVPALVIRDGCGVTT
jgi:hypothetical protein